MQQVMELKPEIRQSYSCALNIKAASEIRFLMSFSVYMMQHLSLDWLCDSLPFSPPMVDVIPPGGDAAAAVAAAGTWRVPSVTIASKADFSSFVSRPIAFRCFKHQLTQLCASFIPVRGLYNELSPRFK